MDSKSLYCPLNESQSEIRLIKIVSAPDDAKVECELSVVSLKNHPAFTALSYVWGDSNITQEILLNGRTIRVTVNLAAALEHVKEHWCTAFPRRDPGELRLWADAICIHQADEKERSSQVQLMRSIYSDAELVISWLGCGSDRVHIAIETLKIIAMETSEQQEVSSMEWLKQYPTWCTWPTGYEERWGTIEEFFQLRYWTRVWIFQELVLGQRVCIAHGATQMDFRDLHNGSRWLFNIHHYFDNMEMPAFVDHTLCVTLSHMKKWFKLERIGLFKRHLKGDVGIPASEMDGLVFGIGDLQATDIRDYVYGIIGLFHTRIVPDYQKNFSSVCHDYVEASIIGNGRLDFLRYAGIGIFDRDPNITLPSWAPNFPQKANCYNSDPPAGQERPRLSLGPTDDQSDSILFEKFSNLPKKDGSFLRTLVLLGGSIVKIHEALPASAFFDERFFKFVQDCIASGLLHSDGGSHPLQQIFRTLAQNDIGKTPEVAVRQALSFLQYLVLGTEDPKKMAQDEMDKRLKLLEFPLENGFAHGFLSVFSIDQDPKWLDYIDQIREEKISLNYIRPVAVGFWSSQILFRFAIFSGGRFGLCPRYSNPGDIAAVVKGCNVPLVIREEDNHYILIGQCFLHEIFCSDRENLVRLTGEQSIREIRLV